MTQPTGGIVAPPTRKPTDEELDVHGLTHRGKVRTTNQDHFLICALRKQMVVQLTSLPDADHLMADGERLAFLAMVADGVGGGAKGGEASKVALEAVTQYVTRSMRADASAIFMAPASPRAGTNRIRCWRKIASRLGIL